MPKVTQEHLDARRQLIVDAARACFSRHGFARTSMADVVTESGLSTGAIYRYFKSKDDLVVAVCEQGAGAFPTALTAEAITGLLEHVRRLARDQGHARLTSQIWAEAALEPALGDIVRQQLEALRAAVIALLPEHRAADAGPVAEAFVALLAAYSQQLAVRDDVPPEPYTRALLAIVDTPASAA